jgi:hypothetical protein
MVTAVYPTHAFSARIGPIFIVKRELNLVVNAFLWRRRSARLIFGGGRCWQREEN